MRVVLDTNVIISGLIFHGREREVLSLARTGRYELYLSPFILEEVDGVLQRKFAWSRELVDATTQMLAGWSTVVEPTLRVTRVQRNDADNRILECAVEATAKYLVTGDRRDLLPLQEFEGVKIVTSTQFLLLPGQSEPNV